MNLLEIKNLSIGFPGKDGKIATAVHGISWELQPHETLGIVGESGSGKSLTALSILRLLPQPHAKVLSGEVLYSAQGAAPVDLLQVPLQDIQKIRGGEIAMVFQEPMTALNPVFRCGPQITEAIRIHRDVSEKEAKDQTLALLEKVRLPDPNRIIEAYPHQISGGQKQRVMIAMALSCHPKILIADEPTTALDVTVQKAILELLAELKAEYNMSMLFISHDLGVISEIADRVLVMEKGAIVESGTVKNVFEHPQSPYTQGLIGCRPVFNRKVERLPTVPDFLENRPERFPTIIQPAQQAAKNAELALQKPNLEVKNLEIAFARKRNWLGKVTDQYKAVQGVSFHTYKGETFGLVGESGCGKTTIGRAICGLQEAYQGEIMYEGLPIDSMRKTAVRKVQMIFQDPFASLNPRMTVGEAILEPIMVHRLAANARAGRERVVELLETVGLLPDHYSRYPHQFSGGQRQRICIGRALALEPEYLICDEIVSALDVSVQATVLNLLKSLQAQKGLTYLFISHDLSVVYQMCDRLAVMERGKIVETGDPESIYNNPKEAYTRQLIEAVPGRKAIR